MNELNSRFLPPDDAQRRSLHNEIHARPSARVRLPALIVYVAVLNEGISREQERAHLQRLPGHADLTPGQLQGNFLRLRCDGFTVKWERHTEFTRYSIVQPLPAHAAWGSVLPELASHVATGTDWLRALPGQTVAAIHLAMLPEGMEDPQMLTKAQQWLGEGMLIGSRMGNAADGQPHSCLLSHLRIGADGFERLLVLASPDTPEGRAGRISQRVLELETYRLMALRGLPVAKTLAPMLGDAEARLAEMPNLKYVPVISNAEAEDNWTGRTGFVHQAVLQDFPDLSGHQVYACGAPIVVDSARADYTALGGLPPDEFYADSFTTEADKHKETA